MEKKQTIQHLLKKDKYVNARGGNSHFLDLFCGKCNQHFALYQKDGQGRLLRMYLDRIFAPQEIAFLQLKFKTKSEMKSLKCSNCGTLIGTPMIYESEKRLAFRIIHGSLIKRKSDGFFPPEDQNQVQKKGGPHDKKY